MAGAFCSTGYSQYYFNPGGTITLPDSFAALAVEELSFPIITADIRSAGMGLTSIADTLAWNAALSNPALFARNRGFSGTFSLYGASPINTLDAISFISDNEDEFVNGTTAQEIYTLVESYAGNPALAPEIGQAIQKLLEVPQQMVEKAIGNPDDPNQNGANLAGNVQVRVGQFGASLTAYGQTGFVINLGPVYRELVDILTTTDFTDTTEVVEAITRLQGISELIIDPATGTVNPGALPTLYSVTYADLVGTLGYGVRLNEAFELGLNVKILNRRFSFDRLSVGNASDIAQDFLSGLESGTTGFTLDIGALYRVSPKVELGVSLQNLIPFQTLKSSYDLNTTRTTVSKELDGNGNPVVNSNGDTSLVATLQRVFLTGPAELKLPFYASAGAMVHATDDLDFTFEWVDIAAQQDVRFDSYIDRFRFGAEYRFHFFGDALIVPVRMGLAELLPTFGVGAGFGKILQIDLAYFTSNLRKVRSLGAQVRLSW